MALPRNHEKDTFTPNERTVMKIPDIELANISRYSGE